jgi:hypothetical protein
METLTDREDKIFKIIDRVLKQVFGEEATNLIYQHLERRYSLSQAEFSEKIDIFARGLEDFLSSGAYVVETKILSDIYSVYGTAQSIGFQAEASGEYDFAHQMRIALQNA